MNRNDPVEVFTHTARCIRTDLLACPQCLAVLRCGDNTLVCSNCCQAYPIVERIPCFATPDSFYDEYSAVHCPFAASPSGLKNVLLKVLPFWSWREWRFWRRAIPRCERLLDLGCGRGREIFMEKARETVGVDGSIAFLRDCARNYTAVVLGQLPHLPIASARFDVVVSSHTIGHVSPRDKDELIAGIARVLKPGGVTAHIIETDSCHPAVGAAKGNPAAYRKQFIEQHGHIGLEPASRVIERFERWGFRLREQSLVDAILPSVLNFRRFFDIPEYADLREIRWPARLSRWTAASSLANLAYEVAFGAFHRTAEQWFGKPEYAQFIHVAFAKT